MGAVVPYVHVALDLECFVSWEISQEGHTPCMGTGDKSIEAFRNKSDGSVGVGMQMRKDVRQYF